MIEIERLIVKAEKENRLSTTRDQIHINQLWLKEVTK